MLASDVKRLRWFGVDMRPQWRRRVTVVVMYGLYLLAVWVHPAGTRTTLDLLWDLFWFAFLWTQIVDAAPRWIVRFCAGGLALVALFGLTRGFLHGDWTRREPAGQSALFATGLLISCSIFTTGGMVESGQRGWLAQMMRKGRSVTWRQQQRLARMGFAVGRDGFAWYEFGVLYKELSEAQRMEIDALCQAHPNGRWGVGMARTVFDDERMQQEDDRLRAQVQRVMVWVLWGSALAWAFAGLHRGVVRSEVVMAWAWSVAALAVTLRQAIVLWTEPDPRDFGEELQLVAEQTT